MRMKLIIQTLVGQGGILLIGSLLLETMNNPLWHEVNAIMGVVGFIELMTAGVLMIRQDKLKKQHKLKLMLANN